LSDGSRIDKWLWGARFFKTRSLARDAVAGGKVELNGHTVKPGRNLKIGDQLGIQRGELFWLVTVSDVNDRRVSAEIAAGRFTEDPASIEKRAVAVEQRRLDRLSGGVPARRPDKRERRRIVSFTRRKE
jgi:ribosome-associated heat shock protein Hsp15